MGNKSSSPNNNNNNNTQALASNLTLTQHNCGTTGTTTILRQPTTPHFPLYEFNVDTNNNCWSWSERDHQHHLNMESENNDNNKLKEQEQQQQQQFSVLTWNVWFSRYYNQERYREIFRICREKSPTVICFQEVTKFFLGMAEREDWIREHYLMSDAVSTGMRTIRSYGVLILVRKDDVAFRVKTRQIHFHSLVSLMERNCIAIDLVPRAICMKARVDEHGGGAVHENHSGGEAKDEESEKAAVIRIGTVHLESLNSRNVRSHQLTSICTELLASPAVKHAILMGDFNFDDERNWVDRALSDEELQQLQQQRGSTLTGDDRIENEILDASGICEFKDVWKELRPSDKGKTFDTVVNRMIPEPYEVMRYDRIIAKSQNGACRATSIEMVGTESFMVDNDEKSEKRGTPVWPSDHFGIHCHFELK